MESDAKAEQTEDFDSLIDAPPLRVWETELVEYMWSQSERAVLRYGLSELDAILCGLYPGDLIVVGGKPGCGKTSFAETLTYNLCWRQQTPGILFASGTKAWFTLAGLAAISARMNYDAVVRGGDNEEETEKIGGTLHHLSQMRLVIDDSVGHTYTEVEERICTSCLESDAQFAVIDMWQGMVDSFKCADRTLLLFKKLAMELEIPIVLFARMCKAGVGRLRYEDVIAGDFWDIPDAVLLMHRDEHNGYGELEFEVVKNRNGCLGSVKTAFIDHQHRIENLALCSEETSD